MRHGDRLAVLVLIGLLAPTAGPPQEHEPEPPSAARPEGILVQALSRVEAGDREGAIALLERARESAPIPPPAIGLLGALQFETGRAEAALETLRPLAERESADPAALYNAARAALAVGREELAERWLSRSVQLAEVSPASRLLGLYRLRQGRFEEAYRLLRPWAIQNPQDQEAYIGAVGAALELDRRGEAIRLLERLPAERVQPALLRARLLREEGDAAAALAVLESTRAAAGEELAVRQPSLAAALAVERGHALSRLDRRAEAATAYRQATELAPSSVEAWRGLGNALLETDQVDAAYEALRRAQDLEAEEAPRTGSDD